MTGRREHGPGCAGCVGPDCPVCETKLTGFEYNPTTVEVPESVEPMWPGGPVVVTSRRPRIIATTEDFTARPCGHVVPREVLVWTHPQVAEQCQSTNRIGALSPRARNEST